MICPKCNSKLWFSSRADWAEPSDYVQRWHLIMICLLCGFNDPEYPRKPFRAWKKVTFAS